jgi:hypothetical protein
MTDEIDETKDNPRARWVIDLERSLLTTEELIVPLVTMRCRLVDRNEQVLADFGVPLDYPSALGFAAQLVEDAEIANLHAKAEAGDEQAKAELEEKAQQWDVGKLKRTYGFDENEGPEKNP